MYEIKKIKNSEIDRSKCETVIEKNNQLIEKPKKENDWWLCERLCKYNERFIWFKNESQDSFFQTLNLTPFEVSKDFFYMKVKEWKKEGCGYFVVV